jgi:tRNA-2-methylthio-N6-dimethylallyladenosine synthase
LNRNRQRIGSLEEILLDGQSKLKNGQMMGRTRGNRIVNVRCPENLLGRLIPIRITGATANSLMGEPLLDKFDLKSQLEGDMA